MDYVVGMNSKTKIQIYEKKVLAFVNESLQNH